MNVAKVGIVLLLMVAAIAAHAAGKTPKTRVGEVFQILPPQTPKLRLPPSSAHYDFHHDIWHTPGKAMIHKECAYDFRNDPGEASCQTVWAHI